MKAKFLKRGNHAHLQLYIPTHAVRVLDLNTRGSKDTEPSPTVSSCGVTRPKCSDLEAVNSKLLTDATLNSTTRITKALDFQAVADESGNLFSFSLFWILLQSSIDYAY